MATRKKKAEEPAETIVACENCRYFKPLASHNECRRNPPAVVPDLSDGGMMSVFPMVGPGEWCGAWAPKLNS
jgi:hypothetical protein